MIKLMTTDIAIGKTGMIGETDNIDNLINLVTCPERYEVFL